jgi:RNA polymerase primary sigma factor
MSKIERRMVMKLGRDPTTEELSVAMDMTPEKINQIKKASLVPISLNQSVNEDDKRTVEETLIDDYTENPNDATGKVLLKEDLENVLNTLNPRERDVLRLRYGLDDGRVKTLEEIGNVFSVTRERIRQIEAKALRKLRQPSRNGVLREYLPSDHDAQIDLA